MSRSLTVDVAKAAGFTLLRVMQSTSPIHSNVAFAAVQSCRTFHAATSTDSTEFEQTVKHRTVVTNVVFALFFAEVIHVVGCDTLQEVDIFVGVELGHLVLGCGLCAVNFEVLVETVVHDEGVSHANAVRLHWVTGIVCVVADIAVVEVGDLLWL